MIELSVLLTILLVAVLYQFFFKEKSTIETFKEFNGHRTFNNVKTIALTSDDPKLLSSAYIRKYINKKDISYEIQANLPNSQGGNYINESIVYYATLDDGSEQLKIGTLSRHNDGFYKLTTILPTKSNTLKNVTIYAQLFTDSKPMDTIPILQGYFT